MSKKFFIALLLSCVLGFPLTARAVGIDSTFKFAWGENVGWLNFGTPEGAVDVPTSGALTGYAWGENVGWISLNCSNTSTCGTVDYKVSRSGDILSGFAWGENVGWISLNCSNTSTCGTVSYGVTVDSASGLFSGYAWGENIGWVVFNCSTTGSCGTVNYKVALLGSVGGGGGGGGIIFSPTPTPGGGGGGGVTISPSPAATPGGGVTPTPTPSGAVTPLATPPPALVSPLPSGLPAPTSPPPSVAPPAPPGVTPPGFWQMLLGNALSLGAIGALALSLVPVLTAAAAILVQNELLATAFSLLQIIGLKRKAKVWGVVYDAKTKHPVPFTKVQLIDQATARVLETRFADRDGRYGFLVSPTSLHERSLTVRILPSKGGYAFPTQTVVLDTDFIVYEHVYHGGPITIQPDTLLKYDIPMDPVGPVRHVWGAWGTGLAGAFTEKLLHLGFIIGLFLVPLNYIWYPTWVNLAVLIVFLAANALRVSILWRPYGIIRDVTDGKPLPFSLVTLNDTLGRRLGFAVSDERGRYFLQTERGQEYQLQVHTPANISPPRTATEHITPRSRLSRRAWVTLKLRV